MVGVQRFFALQGFICVLRNVCAAPLLTNGMQYMNKKKGLNMHIVQNIGFLRWYLLVSIVKTEDFQQMILLYDVVITVFPLF